MENVNKEALASQVKELETTGNIAKAKAWWAGLSPFQKSAVIGLTVGATAGVGYAAYGISIGATVGQSFWAGVIMGTMTGVAANALSLGCYMTAEVINEKPFSL